MAREENVFGLPVTVHEAGEPLDRSEYSAYVVMRCADMRKTEYPIEIRDRISMIQCEQCREMCWYDTKYLVTGLRILCLRCSPPDAEIHARADQVAEVRRAYPRQ